MSNTNIRLTERAVQYGSDYVTWAYKNDISSVETMAMPSLSPDATERGLISRYENMRAEQASRLKQQATRYYDIHGSEGETTRVGQAAVMTQSRLEVKTAPMVASALGSLVLRGAYREIILSVSNLDYYGEALEQLVNQPMPLGREQGFYTYMLIDAPHVADTRHKVMHNAMLQSGFKDLGRYQRVGPPTIMEDVLHDQEDAKDYKLYANTPSEGGAGFLELTQGPYKETAPEDQFLL